MGNAIMVTLLHRWNTSIHRDISRVVLKLNAQVRFESAIDQGFLTLHNARHNEPHAQALMDMQKYKCCVMS